MNIKDLSNRENIDNRQLMKYLTTSRESLGVVMPENDSLLDPERRREMQMNHNGRHALWYLSMALYSVLNGIGDLNEGQKTGRAIAHLAYLIENMDESDLRFKICVKRLQENLIIHYPNTKLSWALFLRDNWTLIHMLAGYFNKAEECFPGNHRKRLGDILRGVAPIKVWWWQCRYHRIFRQLRNWFGKWILSRCQYHPVK